MISFLRKIRQKLLQQKRITQYFAYAVGEIFLVVIGILIALYFNNLNTEKNKQKEINQLLVDIEKDLLLNYQSTNDVLEFYMVQDSIAKLIAEHKLTKADYDASHKLSYFVSNWDYLIPNEENLKQFVEAEKVVSEELKPIIISAKNILLSSSMLLDTWDNLKSNIGDNYSALSKFTWNVKYDSLSNAKRLDYMLNDPEYEAMALGYWGNTQNLYDKITRYRAQTVIMLISIKMHKENYNKEQIINMLDSLSMNPFKEYPCELEPKELPSLKPRRASEIYGNFTKDTVHLKLINNKGTEIINRFILLPMDVTIGTSSEYFGIDGDNNTLVTALDKNGDCIKRYGAIENGYLFLEAYD